MQKKEGEIIQAKKRERRKSWWEKRNETEETKSDELQEGWFLRCRLFFLASSTAARRVLKDLSGLLFLLRHEVRERWADCLLLRLVEAP